MELTDFKLLQRNISWSEYANENIDKFEETGDMFKETISSQEFYVEN